MANPGWSPLASSWAKFHRAGTHLYDLEGELARLAGEYPQPIDAERQINAKEAYWRVTRVPEFREASLFLGDAVNNYRAALDHLAWDLVKLGTHPWLTSKEAKNVQYPLATSWKDLLDQKGRRVPGISKDEWAIIRANQPYRRDERGRALRALRQVSDTDKHRFVVPAIATHTQFVGRLELTGCTATAIWRCPPKRALHVGMKLLRVSFTPTARQYDVKIESHLTVEPSLARGVLLMPTVTAIRAAVLHILSQFEARL